MFLEIDCIETQKSHLMRSNKFSLLKFHSVMLYGFGGISSEANSFSFLIASVKIRQSGKRSTKKRNLQELEVFLFLQSLATVEYALDVSGTCRACNITCYVPRNWRYFK